MLCCTYAKRIFLRIVIHGLAFYPVAIHMLTKFIYFSWTPSITFPLVISTIVVCLALELEREHALSTTSYNKTRTSCGASVSCLNEQFTFLHFGHFARIVGTLDPIAWDVFTVQICVSGAPLSRKVVAFNAIRVNLSLVLKRELALTAISCVWEYEIVIHIS